MKCKHFKIYELVSEIVYNKYGETAWQFFDDRLLETLDAIREHFGKGMTINNWYWKKLNNDEDNVLDERGYRCNLDYLVWSKTKKNVPYCSQHMHGRAVDFNISKMSSNDVYDEIIRNRHKFPYIRRIENKKDATSWTHIDLANIEEEFKIFNT